MPRLADHESPLLPDYGAIPRARRDSHPPPAELHLRSSHSIAIPISYFSVGIAQTLSSAPLQFYLLNDLNVSASRLSVLGPITTLPWCCKILYGIISDYCPIFGERRRPYLALGWVVYALACLVLSLMDHPSYLVCVSLVAVQVFSFILADVICDTLLVERSNVLEGVSNKGEMQATCYVLRFTGSLLGALGGALLGDPDGYFHMSLSEVYGLCAAAGLLPLLATPMLKETSPCQLVELSVLYEILDTVSHRVVWRPMAFIYLYNIAQIGNGAWPNFLTKGLGFREKDLGLLTLAGSAMTWLGVFLYRRFFIHASWRSVYLTCTLITTVFSLLQLILVLRWNQYYGVSDLAFALGDSSVQQLTIALQFLPAVNMFISLCPDGAEGTTFALLTTFSNIAGACSGNLTTALAYMWPLDVSNAALKSQNFDGIGWLTVCTSIVRPLPLLLLKLLPESAEEQRRLQAERCPGEQSTYAALAFLAVLVVSSVWTVVQSTAVVIFA